MAHLSLYPRFSHDPFSLARDLFGVAPANTSAKDTISPRFDAVETEGAYILTADVPGVSESDLDVSIMDNRLTVSGARVSEESHNEDNWHLSERRFGSFSRTFVLPKEADAETVSADLENGVLTLTVNKREQAVPRKIALKINKR